LSQTAVWDHEMVIRKREGQLGLQVANLDTVSFTYMRSAADCVLTTS
jgi:hypothetical protein